MFIKKMLVISVFAFLFFSGRAMGQEGASLSILNIVSAPSGNLQMVVSAVDKQGRPIKGLSNADFKLNIEGEEFKGFAVEPVSSAKSPLSVILGIDVSGSMKGAPITEAKKAASIFLDQLDKEDFSALMAFGSSVRSLSDFSRQKHEIREKIEGLKADEKLTWLYQATYEALEKASKSPTSRAAVVLITDGKDEGSPRTEESVVGMIQGAQIPLYAIGLGSNAQVEYLEKIAGISGGYFLFAPEADKLSELYKMMADQLKNQYLIEAAFPNPPGRYTAVLSLNHKGIETSARRGFVHITPEGAQAQDGGRWFNNPVVWGIMAAAFVVMGIFIAYILRRQEPVSAPPKAEKVRPSAAVMIKKKINPITHDPSYNDLEGANDATFVFQRPSKGTVGLEIDIHQPIPLTFALIDRKNKKEFDEVIISRYDKERDSFYLEEKTYLLLPDASISRPDEGREGHARIFIDKETGAYKIEDLGSASGTKLRETALNKGESLHLEDGDIMTIGNTVLKYYYKEKRIMEETRF